MIEEACTTCRDLLPWYITHGLSSVEQEFVSQHLAHCASCQQALAQWRSIARVVQAVDVPAAPVVSFDHVHQAFRARMLSEGMARQERQRSPVDNQQNGLPRFALLGRRASLPLVSFTAFVVVLAIIGSVLFHGHSGGSPAKKQAVATASTPTATSVPSTPTPTAAPITTIPKSYTRWCGSGTPTAHYVPLLPPPLPVGSATNKGITLYIDKVIADASQTSIFLHFTSSNPGYPASSLSPLMEALTDAHGHFFPTYGANWGTASKLDGSTDVDNEYFTPLPAEELDQTQQMHLIVQSIASNTAAGGPTGSVIDGVWQVNFPVTPYPGRMIPLHTAPQVHCGVAVQPLELDISPGKGYPPPDPLDPILPGAAGGARLLLEISGVPASTDLGSFSFDTSYAPPGDTLPGNGESGSTPLHSQVTIDGTLPATTDIPGFFDLIEGRTPVGPTETVQIEIRFLTPLPKTHGEVSLHINVLDIAPVNAGHPSRYVPGPWDFELNLG